MANHHHHCRLRGGNRVRKSERGDEGVILVLWALCLSMLATLMLGVIALGNLLQSTDNAQNAADAAALAAENLLGPDDGNLFIGSIFIPRNDECDVSQRMVTQCLHYGWLTSVSPTGTYIYEGDEWHLIGNGDVSPTDALRYASNAWICPSLWPGHKHQPARYCEGINIYRPGAGEVNASLSDGSSITEAIDATGKAMSIEQNYGFNSSSGCTAPPDLLLANTSAEAAAQLGESQMGVSCISYDAAGTISVSVLDSGIFPVGGLSAIYKTAWATTLGNGTPASCSGFPPTGNCN